MGLTMKEKQAVTRERALEYNRASKKRKGEILDSVVQLTEPPKNWICSTRCTHGGACTRTSSSR